MIGLIQAIIAIASSAMTCGTICCRDKPTTLVNAEKLDFTAAVEVTGNRTFVVLPCDKIKVRMQSPFFIS